MEANDFVIHGPNLEQIEKMKSSEWGGPPANFKDVRIKDAQRIFDASNDQRKVVMSSERVKESNQDSEGDEEEEKNDQHKKWAEYEEKKKERENREEAKKGEKEEKMQERDSQEKERKGEKEQQEKEELCTSYEEDEDKDENMEIEEEKGENAPETVGTEKEVGGISEIRSQISNLRAHIKAKMSEQDESGEEDAKWGDVLEEFYEGTGIVIEKEGLLTSLKRENEELKKELERKEEGESRRSRKRGEVEKKERSKSRRDLSIEKRSKRPSSRQAKETRSSEERD